MSRCKWISNEVDSRCLLETNHEGEHRFVRKRSPAEARCEKINANSLYPGCKTHGFGWPCPIGDGEPAAESTETPSVTSRIVATFKAIRELGSAETPTWRSDFQEPPPGTGRGLGVARLPTPMCEPVNWAPRGRIDEESASAQPAEGRLDAFIDHMASGVKQHACEPCFNAGWDAALASRQPECIDCAAEVPHDRWGRRRDYPTPHPYTKELQAEFEAGQRFEREHPSRQPDTVNYGRCIHGTVKQFHCNSCVEGLPAEDEIGDTHA